MAKLHICDICGLPCKAILTKEEDKYIKDEEKRYECISPVHMFAKLFEDRPDLCTTCGLQFYKMYAEWIKQRRKEVAPLLRLEKL